MTDFNKASLVTPELDMIPEGSAREIFEYLGSLDRSEKPAFVAYHNGRVAATFTFPGHRGKCESICAYIKKSGLGSLIKSNFSSSISSATWEPI